MMGFRTILCVAAFIAAFLPPLSAADGGLSGTVKAGEDTVMTYETPDTAGKKKVLAFPPQHMIGIQYSYDFSGISFSPDIEPKGIVSPVNVALLYTCYMSLWDMMPYFGLQTGLRYTTEGFTSSWEDCNGTYNELEVPLISQFNYKIGKHLRIIANGGCYYGYRLSVSRTVTDDYSGEQTVSNTFDDKDIRNDYGYIFGGGVGLIFGPVEVHIEANYKRAMCSVYQTTKISDEYWLFGYSNQLRFSIGLNLHIF
ncbi:MAG: PorT family protein [Bacteroidales bacterium]|jgi:hypothetical protein|nr:PorT family protein [Bacteroidales bacterium]MCI2121159.1 PorT family protein [Bacteroidales bacterium]MCI2144748.1 PorT family protein [Bacteroidales bacterium]